MESFESKNIEREPSQEELQKLLGQSYAWAMRIIREHASKSYPGIAAVSVTTQQALDNGKEGLLSVINRGDEVVDIELNETSRVTSGDNTTERYSISFSFDTSLYSLEATGERPDSLEDAFNNIQNEDEVGIIVQIDEMRHRQYLHRASLAETKRLLEILELGAFGNELFDFESFEEQFEEYLDDLNDNHPN